MFLIQLHNFIIDFFHYACGKQALKQEKVACHLMFLFCFAPVWSELTTNFYL